MAVQRWTDEMLDRQAELTAENRAQLTEMRQQLNDLLEGQRMLVQIYQQEHEARVEADRRFNRFIEEQQQLNRQLTGTVQQLTEAVEEIRQLVRFSRENGSQN